MSREALSLAFVLACVPAGILPGDALRGKGRALGPQSRPWALLAAVLTLMQSLLRPHQEFVALRHFTAYVPGRDGALEAVGR